MNNYAHYRIVPAPNVDQVALKKALDRLEVPLNKVTRHVSSQLIESSDKHVTSFVWRAFVDSVNDRYTFPNPAEIEKQLDGKAVVAGREVFFDVEINEK